MLRVHCCNMHELIGKLRFSFIQLQKQNEMLNSEAKKLTCLEVRLGLHVQSILGSISILWIFLNSWQCKHGT
ncbi:unnamed protein product [Linum trigynum]|uniref:Uncharacterized protein n=1 Tax=Linum trigynum TaxID=586398 RepID=A0AAV2DRT3_9ROSI